MLTKALILFAACSLLFHGPVFALDRASFQKKLAKTVPSWMEEQIEIDLASFDKELAEEFLEGLFILRGNSHALTRVQIRNGHLLLQLSETAQNHPTTFLILNGLELLLDLTSLPDVDFIFTSHDTIGWSHNWPIFAESKLSGLPGILMPDRWALRGYAEEKKGIIAGNKEYPWDWKIPLLFFRGADTGKNSGVNWSTWDLMPRVLLVRLSLLRPDLIDARFVHGLNNTSKIDAARREGLIIDKFSPLAEHPCHKYLADLDGNCASCPRTAAIFHSNSVVFKEVSPSRQWWYIRLQPNIHYIPILPDMSDVVSQIEWAKNHDEACKRISENARALVADVLSEESIYLYLYHLLRAYSEKQAKYY